MNALIQVSERVYISDFDPQYDWPSLGYICGSQGCLMVDAGASERHFNFVMGLLKERGLKTPEYLALTHWHWDHCFGLSAFNGVSIAHSKTNEQLKKVAAWSWSEEAMAQRLASGEDIEFCDVHIRKEYPNRDEIHIDTAKLTFEQRLCVHLGDVDVELIHVPSPHSEDTVIVYVPQEKVVFVGDAICEDYYHGLAVEREKKQGLMDVLEGLDFTVCVQGHLPPCDKRAALVQLAELVETD